MLACFLKHCFQCQFLFPRCNLRQGTLTKIRACMRAFAKILRAIRAKVKFCELVQIEWDHSIPLKLVCCGVIKEYRVQIGSHGIFTIIQSSIFVQRVARQSFDNNKENSVTLAGFKQQESTLQTHCISEPFLLFSFQSSVTLLSITEEFHCC